MPALPIIVLAEQGYTLPDWFISFLTLAFFIVMPFFAINSVIVLIKLLKGEKDKNEK